MKTKLHAVRRLRDRLRKLTLTLGLQDYQRNAIEREFDEWTARELGRLWSEAE